MSRKQRVSPNAKRTSIYLTTAQEHALMTIEHERRHRKEGKDSPSEIVADAIWLLGERYHVSRKEIEARFPEPIPEQPKNKVTILKPRKR